MLPFVRLLYVLSRFQGNESISPYRHFSLLRRGFSKMVYISCWVGGPDRPIAANARKSGNQIGKRWRWRAGCWRCTNRQNERKSLCVIPPLRTLIPPVFSTLHHCAAYCSRNVPQLSVAGGTATGVPLFILSSSSLSSSPPFLFIFRPSLSPPFSYAPVTGLTLCTAPSPVIIEIRDGTSLSLWL